MRKLIQFGENVQGYNIPVFNEREIRAAAGLLFLPLFVAVLLAILIGSFLLLKYFIIIFLADMLIRFFVNPKFAPMLIVGRWIVRNQTPEYVGAPQKRFAWGIGLFLASLMFVLSIILNTFSVITGLTCLICMIFLFFETAFGICLGCKFYGLFYKEKAQYCPGEVCDVKARHEIQKISWKQALIVFAFAAYITAAVFLFNDTFKEPSTDLFNGKTLEQINK